MINLIKNEENEIKSENEYVCSCSRNCRITLYSVEIDSRITLENSENSANSFVKIFFSSNMITTIEEQRGKVYRIYFVLYPFYLRLIQFNLLSIIYHLHNL